MMGSAMPCESTLPLRQRGEREQWSGLIECPHHKHFLAFSPINCVLYIELYSTIRYVQWAVPFE